MIHSIFIAPNTMNNNDFFHKLKALARFEWCYKVSCWSADRISVIFCVILVLSSSQNCGVFFKEELGITSSQLA